MKDIKHQHYFMTNCYEDLRRSEQATQFDHLCSTFYEAADIANSNEKYEYLMKCIYLAKEKLIDILSWLGWEFNIVRCFKFEY